jgi:hypothetical protein
MFAVACLKGFYLHQAALGAWTHPTHDDTSTCYNEIGAPDGVLRDTRLGGAEVGDGVVGPDSGPRLRS